MPHPMAMPRQKGRDGIRTKGDEGDETTHPQRVLGADPSVEESVNLERVAERIMSSCRHHFTQAMQHYRRFLRAHPKGIVQLPAEIREQLFTQLILASLRVGRSDI